MFIVYGRWYNFLIAIILLPLSNSGSYYSFEYSSKYFKPSLDNEANWLCLILGICTTPFYSTFADYNDLKLIYKWSQLEFDYPSLLDRDADINSGFFIPGQPAPIDVDVYYADNRQDKVFVTIPRFQPGSPATLGYVSDKHFNGNPVIVPYPDWSWHRSPNQCKRNRMISVYRVQIDECGRLWVIDTGRYLDKLICPPLLLAFDLRTNKLVHRYEIPNDQIESRSIIVTPIVDIRDGKCNDAFVYLADVQTYSIIVYDVKRQRSWQVNDKTFYPYPNFGTFTIEGESFDLMDGILGMALEPYRRGQDRKLFYHALASGTENWVYTSDLRNQSRFIDNPQSSPEIFHVYEKQRSTQSAAEATDDNGIMYYGSVSDSAIRCWDTRYDYETDHNDIIAQNAMTLQFASGVKVIRNRNRDQQLWVLTCRFQKIYTGTINPNETNFRIHAGKVDDITHGSRCSGPKNSVSGGGYGLYRPSK